MEVIKTVFPNVPTESDMRESSQKLEYLFKDKDFQEQVRLTRKKFNIPLCGIIEGGKDFDLFASLMLDKKSYEYCKPKIKKKHRYEELNLELRKIIDNVDLANLPIRFIDSLRDYVVLNRFPTLSSVCKTLIRVCDDKGVRRLFVEVFADTKKEDLERAWKQVECAKEGCQLKGWQLANYKNYYKTRIKIKGQKPVDERGKPFKTDEQGYDTDDSDLIKDNIDKHRFKEFHKKHYSK